MWEVSCFSSFKVHKTVANHTKLPEILMSNMAAPTDFLQILQTTIITDYISNWGRDIAPLDIRLC